MYCPAYLRVDLRTAEAYSGYSINITLSDRGFAALSAINVDNKV